MTFKEIKEWVNKVPDKFDDFTVVNGEFTCVDEEFLYRVDKPITTLVVDEKTNEILFLNDIEDSIEQG